MEIKFVLLLWMLNAFQTHGLKSSINFPRASEDSECVTVDGATPGQPCVFPFIFGTTTYNECIPFSDPDLFPWCSTKVDENGNHVAGGGFWGHCSDKCPGSSQQTPTEDNFEEEKKLQEDLEQEKAQPEVKCKTASGADGQCLIPSLCVGVTDSDIDANKCPEEKGANGETLQRTCCPEPPKNPPKVTFESTETKVEDAPKSVSADDIRSAFNINESEEVLVPNLKSVPEPEDPIVFNNSEDDDADAEMFHLRFNQASTFAIEVNDAAQDLLEITNTVKTMKNLTDSEAGIGLRSFNAEIEIIDKRCPWTPKPVCTDLHKKTRTMDGSCNNLLEPNYGRAGTPLQRILDPSYGDAKFNSPRASVKTFGDGFAFELPSARLVSTTMTQENNMISSEHTVLLMQMGQFIDHDITFTPTNFASCCKSDGSFPEFFDTKKCFPIEIPGPDPFWRGRKACMSFTRSLASPTLKCSLEFQQQMNQITHWLDASNIYGSSESESKGLRENFQGLLKMGRVSGTKLGLLPSCSAAKSVSMCSGCSKCFFAGDSRANEHLNLLSMHTLWVREHNRIARFLKKLNPGWNDERLFQTSRKIVIAEYQHIIFKEWLPIIVGSDFMTNFGLWPLSKDYSKDYLNSFDPRVTNEFSTAAFRFGHSLIPTLFDRISPRRIRQGKNAAITATMNLKEIFFKPQQLSSAPGILDELVAGLATQEGNQWDNNFAPDVRDHLFESTTGEGGLDLVALNIQRGRDHGIKGYNAYREICSLPKATTWTDFHDLLDPIQVEKLSQLYSDIDDVDLFVGGFLEQPDGDAILGPTFRCIIGDTFARLKLGDRFFYDLNVDEFGPHFTEDELTQIRKASMARIICDNTDNLDAIQPQAFKLQGSSSANTLQFCGTSPNIPFVNLGVFKDSTKFGR